MMSRLILAAIGAAFVLNGPALAEQQVRSQAEKRLETQRKDLTRNWGARVVTPQPGTKGSGVAGSAARNGGKTRR